MSTFKPMLACDADLEKIRYPVLAQPKVDGVRGMVLSNHVARSTRGDYALVGRNLKPHANRYTTSLFSHWWARGLDGELYTGRMNSPSLCRDTTSALNTIEGQPKVLMMVFDYLVEETVNLPYAERLAALDLRKFHNTEHPVHVVSSRWIHHPHELQARILDDLEAGYEGTILRDPYGMHKQGRSTAREGGLLRVKQFVDDEAVVVSLVQGQRNDNPATRNLLGQTERSTHKAGMVPNGQVGTLICLYRGQEIEVAPGRMTLEERRMYWADQQLLIGQYIKFKHFPLGVKDKPRFPTFQSIRMASDLP